MSELISIIVPVYKVEKYLKRCIDSIINQTYKNLEIILVDDGSPDNCGQICDEYAEKDSRIKVIHKENHGVSAARNTGIDIAAGEYLGFVDSDDWIEKDMYELLYYAIKKHSVKMSCAGRYSVNQNKKTKFCYRKEEAISSEEMLIKIFKQKECDISIWDKLYHRSLFDNIRFPVGKRHEELAIIHKIIFSAERIAVINRPLYNYRQIPSSFTKQRLSKENLILVDYADQVVEFCADNYPSIKKYALAFSAKKRLELCIKVTEIKNSTLEEDLLAKELFNDLFRHKAELTFFDKIRYIVLLTGTYPYVRDFIKGIACKK